MSGATTTSPRAAAPGGAEPRARTSTAPTVVLVASARAEGGGPAAAQPWLGATVLDHLLAHVAGLGAGRVHLITRPEFAERLQPAVAAADVRVDLHASPDLGTDLELISTTAAAPESGSLVVMYGDLICHREALAGLMADPRLATAMLCTGGRSGRPFTYRARVVRGRVVSAAGPFHSLRRSSMTFLGVLKVSPADRPALAQAAASAAAIVRSGIPGSWSEEIEHKAGSWRGSLFARRARAEAIERGEVYVPPEPPEEGVVAEPVVLVPEDEAELERRLAAAREDAVGLAFVAFVRTGVRINSGYLRGFFWSRPLSVAALERASEGFAATDEDKLLLASAVKGSDGFFTTYFVSPYSQYIARWCARRGFTPNQVTTVSLLLGFLSAAAFALGSRGGMIAGAVLLQIAFTTDCVDGQLARYTRQFSKLGAWMDSVFDRTKEYAVFAGLAIGAGSFGQDVWVLAAAAMALQTIRHTIEFSYAAARHEVIASVEHPPLEEPSDVIGGRRARESDLDLSADGEEVEDVTAPLAPAPGDVPASKPPLARRLLGVWRRADRSPNAKWVRKIVALPIGERFAAISITAAFFTPETVFVVLLAWGGFAFVYTMLGRTLRSAAT